ncbi:MAG: hypothetical protein NXI24_02195 [bacterium]|nr:hypothetical protein [bacterium]
MTALPTPERDRRRGHLRQLGDVLINPEEPVERLRAACADLEEILIELHGVPSAVTAEDQRYRHASDFGEVISPGYAISTMQDAIRTAKFLRVLVAAIRKRRAERPDERVHILYPGPGPNAPFFILATAYFSPEEIGYTMIEYMQESFDGANRLIQALAFEEYVNDFQHGDAVLYKHAGPPAHILIAEIMQQGLRGEPQFAIFKNLVPQLAEDSDIIPFRIELRAGLTDPESEFKGVKGYPLAAAGLALRQDLGRILVLDQETLIERHKREPKKYARLQDWETPDFKAPPVISNATTFTVFTIIHIGEDVELREGESGLTMPLYRRDIPVIAPGDDIRCKFKLGATPGLVFEHVRPRMRILQD